MNSFDELYKKFTQYVANNVVLKRKWNEAEQLMSSFLFCFAVIGV